MRITRIKTPLGVFIASYSARGLSQLEFPSKRSRPKRKTNRAQPSNHPALPAPSSALLARWERATAAALRKALAGHRPGKLPPLDWSSGTSFHQRVWAALQRIPPGQVQTYAQVAAAVGRPRAARAVGAACGANPIPVLVPCHRIVAANGGLGGFSAGLAWKRRLLQLESLS
jgi:methylated-DNA-[protein]-cysteine S-methyltransferase